VTATILVATLNVLRKQYRWIVVDTSSSFSEFNLSLFDHADLLLVVTGSDLTSLKVTQATLDIFAALFVPSHKRVLVLNHAQPYALATREAIERALGERIDLVVPHGGEAFATAADTGRPLALSDPEHPSVQALAEFARKLAGVEQPAAARAERLGWAARLKRLLWH
jgi:pilus assembly protein CpaE